MDIPNSIKNADRDTLEKLAWGWYKDLCDMERKANCKLVNRVEVIDGHGRSYVNHLEEDEFVWLSYQDDGRTLKVFVDFHLEVEQ
jgi:hypothetical protein